MHLLIIIIHLIACFSLIMIVLLQSGKGQSMGAMFGGGGGSKSLFGSGASSFMTKATTTVAVVFMLTSLTLAYVSKTGQDSIIRDFPAGTQQEQPQEQQQEQQQIPAADEETNP
jgi:preprotein translocase subunit SecG